MDKAVVEAVTALVNNALTEQLVWVVIVTLITAALTAFFNAYLVKTAQRRADKEAFKEVLQEEVQKTFALELTKSQFAKDLEDVRSDLQRKSAFTSFQRDLVTKHQDNVFVALKECAGLADLVKHKWQWEELLERRSKMVPNLQAIEFSMEFLSNFGQPIPKGMIQAIEEIDDAWEEAMSLKFRGMSEFRAQHPETLEPNVSDFVDSQNKLTRAVNALKAQLFAAIRAHQLPL